MALTAPSILSGLEFVNTAIKDSGLVKYSASNMEMIPYWVATARYLPDFEKVAAKLPRMLLLSSSRWPSNCIRHERTHS
jgi:hypothetical protein